MEIIRTYGVLTLQQVHQLMLAQSLVLNIGDLGSCAAVTNVPATFSFNCSSGSAGLVGSPLYANGTTGQTSSLRVPINNAVNGQASLTVTVSGVGTLLLHSLRQQLPKVQHLLIFLLFMMVVERQVQNLIEVLRKCYGYLFYYRYYGIIR